MSENSLDQTAARPPQTDQSTGSTIITANQLSNETVTQTNRPPVVEESTNITENKLSNETVTQTSQPPVDEESTNITANQLFTTNQIAARPPQTNQPDQSPKIMTVNQLSTHQHHIDKGLQDGQSATKGTYH